MTWRGSAAARRRGCRCSPTGNAVPTARGKRGKGHRMVPFPPLDSPKPSFEPLSKAFAAKRGLRGFDSVRRAGFGTLLCPEFPLRYPPRTTVRGQTVQGVGLALRKALLQSRMIPWSTRRPCGPLVFRRATGGSRVQRRVWGVKRGKGTIGALSPLVSAGRPRHSPPPDGGNARSAHRQPFSPPAAHRCIGGDKPSAEGKEKGPHCLRQQNCNYIPFKEGVSHRYVNPC